MPVPRFQDYEYVRARNALVKEAERIANALAGEADRHVWTRCFVKAMDESSAPPLKPAYE